MALTVVRMAKAQALGAAKAMFPHWDKAEFETRQHLLMTLEGLYLAGYEQAVSDLRAGLEATRANVKALCQALGTSVDELAGD